MVKDVKRRAPYYWSDLTDAWDYRIVPATVYMFFAKYVGRHRCIPSTYLSLSGLVKDKIRSLVLQHLACPGFFSRYV